ncbi:MAG: hypothetical protein ACRDPY_21440 [Streptosporangiaceae bacterium]
MTWDALENAGAGLLRRLGPSALRTVAGHACDTWPREAILRATPSAETLLDALAEVDRSAGLAYLTGLAAGYAQRAGEVTVETVWSGPGAKMHAKLAVADRRVLLVTSANLTQSGVAKNFNYPERAVVLRPEPARGGAGHDAWRGLSVSAPWVPLT